MIVLVGFMGAGKTTVGRLLAARLGLPFVDTDDELVARTGRTIPEIFATDGEQAFRDLEQAAVADVLAGGQAVVSLGGGACGREATRELLRAQQTFHLAVSWDSFVRRTAGDTGRPMLTRPDLPQLHADRAGSYDAVCVRRIDTDDRTPDEVADDVLATLEETR